MFQFRLIAYSGKFHLFYKNIFSNKLILFWTTTLFLRLKSFVKLGPGAVFLVTCDPSMNELWVTYTGLCIDLYGSRSLTARSEKGRTRLKIWPLNTFIIRPQYNEKGVKKFVRTFIYVLSSPTWPFPFKVDHYLMIWIYRQVISSQI